MNKDEQYVRSVWAASPVKQEFDEDGPMNLWSIHEWISSTPLFAYESQDAAWSAAAEFTRERVEEVRQLRASISELLDDLCEDDKCKRCIRFKFAASQLQVILTERTAGMKLEAL